MTQQNPISSSRSGDTPESLEPLVSTEWLASRLGAPDLRVIDATVFLDPDSWEANTGRTTFLDGHIPGADFIDLIGELSDPRGDEGLPPGVHGYQLPSAEDFAACIGRHGIGNESTVIAYDTSAGMWAARLWWMLRYFGHERVAVLDGGWQRWLTEGRPVSREIARPEPQSFTPRPQPALLARKEQVREALADEDTVLVNALWPEQFRGEGFTPLARPGRIPGSVNVPFTATYEGVGILRSPSDLQALFTSAGVTPDKRVVTYCGGGIAAAANALALSVAGIDAALYDGSLVEWVADEECPLEVGEPGSDPES
jgi:thiosulfate/3-mercaptopyruvate sulfurtransferase